ncbi:MAG: hypothetical protein J5817_00540 [Treponema sp.]|nr:hypothetical protein [Treponema sp.]
MAQPYCIEGSKEIKNVLHSLALIPDVGFSAKVLLVASLLGNIHPYSSYFMYLKDGASVKKAMEISSEDRVWEYKDGFAYYYFSPSSIEKIIPKMKMGVKKMDFAKFPC